MSTYDQHPETTPSRHPERARYDAGTVHAILDEALIGHLGFMLGDVPQVLPTLFVRVGDIVYLHSSTGARPARMAQRRRGIPASFEVTLMDGLVLARSMFNHSINYRSVVIHGEMTVVDDNELKKDVLLRLVEKIVAGRGADAREPDDDELRQTALLALPLVEVSAKVRAGDPHDDERDMDSKCWAGVVPLVSGRGEALASGDLASGIATPAYLAPRSLDAGLPQ